MPLRRGSLAKDPVGRQWGRVGSSVVRLTSAEAQERLASLEKLFMKASEFFSVGSVMEETNDF